MPTGATWDKISSTFYAMWVGSMGSGVAITNTTAEAAPLICAGLGVAVAFRAGLFNIGAQGQAMLGALTAAFVGFSIKGLPMAIHLPLVILIGIVAGAIWGGIVGLIKARTGAHEVILTIMMNYIAGSLLAFLMLQSIFQAPGRADPISPVLEWSATMPRLDGTRLHLGFFLALLAAFAVWWLLERTKFGIHLKAVGLNPNAAATSGASVPTITMLTMALAGGLAGLAGVQAVTAPELLTGFPPQMTGTIIGTLGFDAITVALLGRSAAARRRVRGPAVWCPQGVATHDGHHGGHPRQADRPHPSPHRALRCGTRLRGVAAAIPQGTQGEACGCRVPEGGRGRGAMKAWIDLDQLSRNTTMANHRDKQPRPERRQRRRQPSPTTSSARVWRADHRSCG